MDHQGFPDQVSKRAIDSFDQPITQWTEEQRDALCKCKSLMARCMSVLDSDDMDAYRKIFRGPLQRVLTYCSTIFFCGDIDDVKLVPSADLYEEDGSFGMTYQSKPDGAYVIEIDLAGNISHRWDDSISQTVMGTLLHECVHAYLRTMACQGNGDAQSLRCNSLECRLVWRMETGTSGHGRVWQELAEAVERRANAVMELPVRLSLHQ